MKILFGHDNVNNSYDMESITVFHWPATNSSSVGFSSDCYTFRPIPKHIMFSVRKAISEAAGWTIRPWRRPIRDLLVVL